MSKRGMNPNSRANLRPNPSWTPGRSGNLGGRSQALADVERLCRAASPEAVAALRQIIAEGESDTARVSAANALLDRGFGRPAQTVTVRKITSIEDLGDDELLAILGEEASDVLGRRDGESEH